MNHEEMVREVLSPEDIDRLQREWQEAMAKLTPEQLKELQAKMPEWVGWAEEMMAHLQPDD